jgi:hypothetical protein
MKCVLEASKIGRTAWRRLKEKGAFFKAKVISIYPHTINLKLNELQMLSLTAKNIASPITIALNPLAFLQTIKTFESFERRVETRKVIEVEFSGEELTLHFPSCNMTIDLKNAHLLPNIPLAPIGTNALTQIRENIVREESKTFCTIASLLGKYLDSFILHKILETVKDVRNSMRMPSKMTYLPETAYSFIGLGPGATPSYDDFLSGFIGSINYVFQSALHHKAIIYDPLKIFGRTTDTSAFLIIESLEGKLPYPLLRGFHSLLKNDVHSSIFHLMDLLHYGHDSGVYLFAGFLAGFLTLRDSLTQKAMKETNDLTEDSFEKLISPCIN